MAGTSQIFTPNFEYSQLQNQPNEDSRENDLRAPSPTVTDASAASQGGDEQMQPSTQHNETILTFETVVNQLPKTSKNEWMENLIDVINERFRKRVPRGGWQTIKSVFNRNFECQDSLINIKNLYNRAKCNRNKNGQPGNDSLPVEVLRTITNTDLFNRVKQSLMKNITLYDTNGSEKVRTKKVYSAFVNNEIIDIINTIITRENFANNVTSLKQLNNMFYACQKTHDEITEKPRVKSKWKETIQNKIDKRKSDLLLLQDVKQNSTTPEELKRLCKKNNIHSKNNDKINELKDNLTEQIASYEKKIRISEKRIEFRRTNMRFEFNRSSLYRSIDGESSSISPEINHDETAEFWKNIWREESVSETPRGLIETLQPIQITSNLTEVRVKEIMETSIKHISNWKAPGHDQVYNFFIKKITTLHPKLFQLTYQALLNPDLIDNELYNGVTYLLPKRDNATQPEELRPITCLPNIYKLVSKTVTKLVSEMCELNDVISPNQLGTKNKCQGAKQQALTNKTLNKYNDNQLKTSWIDIKKAFDSVNHEYLIGCIERLALPGNIISFIKRMLVKQTTTLYLNGKPIGEAKLEKGVIQGDSLSPLLFVIAMEPLSRMLNEHCDKVAMNEQGQTINHLIFIDDIKLLANDNETLVELCEMTDNCLSQMSLTINQQKSASNIDDPRTFGEKLDDVQGYKYLGILEDSRSAIKPENKEKIKTKIIDRITKLCATKLNARNLFHAINEFAISTINYYVGVINYEPNEFEDLDKAIRGVLAEHNVTRKASNMERLYMSRSELGRGLQNIKDKSELMLLNLHEHLSQNSSTRPIIEIERALKSHFGLIVEYLTSKYQLTETTTKQVRQAQARDRIEKIKQKRMHGVLFENEERHVDTQNSSLWLKKGNISPQEEGMLCKLQDRNLFHNIQTCPHCHMGNMTVDHLATNCGKLLNHDYKKRHNDIVRNIHFMFARKYGLQKSARLKNYKVQNVISNQRVRIKSDIPIITETRIDNNKPDLLIHDLKTNVITLVEVGVTNKRSLQAREIEKAHKYELLANELKIMYPGAEVKVIPIVITWDGLVTRYNRIYMEQLGISKKIQAYIQAQTIKRTCESILIDARKSDLHRMMDDEEMQQTFDNLCQQNT